MYSINQVTIQHINHLSDIQLSKLLHSLLTLEAQYKRLQGWDESVPFNITTGDGGSDGRIQWTGEPEQTHWLPNKFMIFQNKATDLFPKECYEEILRPQERGKPRELKSEIKALVEGDGCYVLFTNRSFVDKQKKERIDNFRNAIKDAGHSNHSTFEIKVYDANSIKDWVNQYIEAVTMVQDFNGVTRPLGFRTWKEWGIDIRANENAYQTNTIIEDSIKLISTTIESVKVLRVVGHSGLGKTRLVYEAFRPAKTAEESFKSGMVYYDAGLSNNTGEIAQYILAHRRSQNGIIIVDNCDVETHIKLSSIVKHQGELKIITIGLDDSRSLEDAKIRLDRNNQRDVIAQIVEQKLAHSHSKEDREYIVTLSEGYPWMAVKFCDSVLKTGLMNLNQYPLDEFIRKLLFGMKPENDIEYEVISACSVFSSFGFLDDSFRTVINQDVTQNLQSQMDYIRTKIYDGNITESTFRSICTKFRNEDIIEKRGTYYIVKPTILAIHLAAHWLVKTPTHRIKSIIEELRKVGLEEKFIDRLSDLDQIDKAKELVFELWGPTSFFGSAEVLNTQWGSLLFRYVVEVNPSATVKSLENAFMSVPTDALRNLTDGRRNLVWALEKLVFRKESFVSAAKILYKFAVAENETWANNATNQFVHLFQIYLPGTEVSYDERLKIIDWGLQQDEPEYKTIAVSALGRGLLNDHFSRTGGAEQQGSSAPLKDYEPATWGELYQYWDNLLGRLTDIAIGGGEVGEAAKKAIVQSIRLMIRDGQWKRIESAIRKILEKQTDTYWHEALNALKMAIGFEKHLPSEQVLEINNLISELTPQDLEHQIVFKVSKPEWYHHRNEMDMQQKKAEEFAEEVVSQNLPLEVHFDKLLQGEQRQGYNFGFKLAQLINDKTVYYNKLVEAIKGISKDNQNPEFLVGFAMGTNDSGIKEDLYDKFISDEFLMHNAFYYARVLKPSLKELFRLFDLIETKHLPISHFAQFQYGRILDSYSKQEVLQLCAKIATYGNLGRWTSLALIFMYCYADKETGWEECIDFIVDLVLTENMAINVDNIHTMDSFHWSEAVKKIIELRGKEEILKKVSVQIQEILADHQVPHDFRHYLSEIIKLLFDKNFDLVWSILGEGLISKDYIYFMHFKDIVGSKNGWMGGNGCLFGNPAWFDTLVEWSRNNPEKGPKRVANMMPLAVDDNGKAVWHPFSKRIIDEFGSKEGVLASLSANMGTYGSVNSRIPYLQQLQSILEQLTDHSLIEVRTWATNELSYINKEIEREKLSNEEDFIA
jgi:hypothetical protein